MNKGSEMEPYYDQDGITIFHGDCREILPGLEKVDLLLTDPPYGIGDRMQGGTWGAAAKYSKFREWDKAPSSETLQECIGLSSEHIIWGGNYFPLPPSRCWLCWRKVNSVPTMAGAELAWTSWDKPVRAIDLPVGSHKTGHPSEKPLPLIKWCMSFAPNAQTILDPFMGSGTTLVAAKLEGRRAIGIELEERYCEIAVNRLKQRVLEFSE